MTSSSPVPHTISVATENTGPDHPEGKTLTTSQGAPLADTDHERIPERVVHARGAGAHGWFLSYGIGSKLSPAGFLAEGVETPVFVRFSTVAGSRGSADTVRDTRGFATKF